MLDEKSMATCSEVIFYLLLLECPVKDAFPTVMVCLEQNSSLLASNWPVRLVFFGYVCINVSWVHGTKLLY